MHNQYLDVFLEEAKEHIDNLNKYLLELENNPTQEIVDEIFRSAHTLKGMSGTMGYVQLLELAHEMENVLQKVRSHEININTQIIDTLLRCVDVLEKLISDIEEYGKEKQRDIHVIINQLKGKNSYHLKGTRTIVEGNEKDYDFNEYEARLARLALKEGFYIWEVSIELVDECLLKSARAFLVFKTLERFGDIIKTEPIVQDIEDEKFDDKFTLFLITLQNKEEIFKSLETVSELSNIEIKAIGPKSIAIEEASIDKDISDFKMPKTSYFTHMKSKGFDSIRKTSKTLRVDIERLDILMNLVSELIIIKTRLNDIDNENIHQARHETIEYLERITSNLHDAVMKARMVPIENVFNRFPRVVRDLARELSKKINLLIDGAETELDRTIIDEIGDPLIHLIRNAADHGIESPHDRVAKGKPEHGTIALKAYHDGNNVVIEVSDDGKGINPNYVLKRAIAQNLTNEEQSKNLNEHEIISFLFEPGFSTTNEVTDVSGRGVGLDVVRTKIESLGGSIEIDNKRDIGTTFQVRLPLTLAIIQALMVMVGGEKYAIPLSSIKETIIVSRAEIKKVQKGEVILLRGNIIPIIRLNKLLNIKDSDNPENLTLVIVKKGEKDIGLTVDNLIGQQEIVIKTLGDFFDDIKFIAGATILGNGEVALILDTSKLV